MTDKEKLHEIKEEIKKRIRLLDKVCNNKECETTIAYNDILKFIDSLPEQPTSEDLDEEIKNYFSGWCMRGSREQECFFKTARHFAEWQRKKDQETIELAEDHAMLAGMMKEREEMMKDAIEVEIFREIKGNSEKEFQLRSVRFKKDGIKLGDKVKIIIVKED